MKQHFSITLQKIEPNENLQHLVFSLYYVGPTVCLFVDTRKTAALLRLPELILGTH